MFTRDIKKLAQAFSVFDSSSNSSSLFSTSVSKSPQVHAILYPKDFLPTENEAQMAAIDSFVGDLESSLGLKRTEISISDSWLESGPENTKPLHSYLEFVCTYSNPTFEPADITRPAGNQSTTTVIVTWRVSSRNMKKHSIRSRLLPHGINGDCKFTLDCTIVLCNLNLEQFPRQGNNRRRTSRRD